MLDRSPDQFSEVPARIAIPALRARTGRKAPTSFLLNADPGPLTLDRIAQRLAQMPKPLRVSGVNERDHLHIHAAPLVENSVTKNLYDRLQESYATQGGVVGFLATRHEGDISGLTVLCVGGGHMVSATVRDVRDWQRDYWVEPCGYGADFADSPFGLGLGLATADLSGVAAVIGFSSGGGTWESSVGGIVDMRGTF